MARRRATDAERTLWAAAVRGVDPLRPHDALASAPPVIPPAPAAIPELPVSPIARPAPGGVDRATIDRLRGGRVRVEARIDLHGLDQTAAFAALMRFLDLSVRAERRAVLVITGKGAVSQGGGVIRRNAPNWLLASPYASRILTIQPAHVTHGGDGAFYVMLRRERRLGTDRK